LGIAVVGIEGNNSLHKRFWFNNKPGATTLVLALPFGNLARVLITSESQ